MPIPRNLIDVSERCGNEFRAPSEAGGRQDSWIVGRKNFLRSRSWQYQQATSKAAEIETRQRKERPKLNPLPIDNRYAAYTYKSNYHNSLYVSMLPSPRLSLQFPDICRLRRDSCEGREFRNFAHARRFRSLAQNRHFSLRTEEEDLKGRRP